MRSLFIKLSVLLAILAQTQAFAAGFGQAQMKSHLGEPLNLLIPVLGVDEFSDDNLHFSIGSKQAYKDLKVDFHFSHYQLIMKVLRDKDEHVTLQIKSQHPITEPFLDFVLQLTSPTGTFLKEITTFLEPPSF